jgi:UPF0716 protein FxsA
MHEPDSGDRPEQTHAHGEWLDRDVVQPHPAEAGLGQDVLEPRGVDVVDRRRDHASTVALYDAGVFLVVLLLVILIPVAELIVMFKVAAAFGWLETLSVLILVSMVGAWLVRRQGLTMVMRIQRELTEGNVPTKSVVDGLLLLVAGVLLLTPGFISDAFGILLLFPPTRIALRSLVIRRYRSRLEFYKGAAPRMGGMWSRIVINDDIIDTEGHENRPRRDPSGELEP